MRKFVGCWRNGGRGSFGLWTHGEIPVNEEVKRRMAQRKIRIQTHSRKTSTSSWNQRVRAACCERRASIAAGILSLCRQIFPAKSRANANSAQTALSRRRVAVARAKTPRRANCGRGRTQPTQGNRPSGVEPHRRRNNCTKSSHPDSRSRAEVVRFPLIHDDSTGKQRSLRSIPSPPHPCTRHTQGAGTRVPAESLRA